MDSEPRIDIKRAWYLGNTTVREAQRLRAGLTVLAASPLNGNLEGRERETAFARLLDANEVLHIQREAGEDTDSEAYLQIIPLTLQQFTNLFKGAFGRNGSMDYMLIETLLRDCLADVNSPAPVWKRSINQRVERFIANRFQGGQENQAHQN